MVFLWLKLQLQSPGVPATATQEIKVSMEEFLAKAPGIFREKMTVESPVFHGKPMENQWFLVSIFPPIH